MVEVKVEARVEVEVKQRGRERGELCHFRVFSSVFPVSSVRDTKIKPIRSTAGAGRAGLRIPIFSKKLPEKIGMATPVALHRTQSDLLLAKNTK